MNLGMVVYRFYCDSELLYIGSTTDFARRTVEHAISKPWWSYVTDYKVVPYPTRAAMNEAEIAAIHSEAPIFNIAHNDAGAEARKRRFLKAHPRPLKRGWTPGHQGVLRVMYARYGTCLPIRVDWDAFLADVAKRCPPVSDP